jgi:hypothetical protein
VPINIDDAGGPSKPARAGERLLRIAEDAVYVAIAVLLVAGALVLILDAASELTRLSGIGGGEDGAGEQAADVSVLAMLDRLLLVFVLVELIFAVRTTLSRREIVAEPFLIVGIIASIKEIILLSVEAGNVLEGNPTTDGHAKPELYALLIGLLGILVVVLAASAVLLRVKEREPAEGARREEETDEEAEEDAAARSRASRHREDGAKNDVEEVARR